MQCIHLKIFNLFWTFKNLSNSHVHFQNLKILNSKVSTFNLFGAKLGSTKLIRMYVMDQNLTLLNSVFSFEKIWSLLPCPFFAISPSRSFNKRYIFLPVILQTSSNIKDGNTLTMWKWRRKEFQVAIFWIFISLRKHYGPSKWEKKSIVIYSIYIADTFCFFLWQFLPHGCFCLSIQVNVIKAGLCQFLWKFNLLSLFELYFGIPEYSLENMDLEKNIATIKTDINACA